MARAFDSTAKKLAIPLFALFEIGWIIFIAGFILLFKSRIRDIILDDNDIKSPEFFPYFMILVGGQFVILLGLLHAALPSGTASSYIGSISTVLNIIYFVSVGYLISDNCFVMLYFKWGKYFQEVPVDHDDEQQLMRAASLMLAGSIVLVVSWSLVQFVSFFYEHRPQPALSRNLWYVIVECWKNRTLFVGDVSESVRLASILAMLLSAIGWGVYMGGLFNMENIIITVLLLLGGWGAVIIPPFMYLASLFHAGCTGKASTVLGIIASILNTFFIVGMGFSVTFTAVFLYQIIFEVAAAKLVLISLQLDVEKVKKHNFVMLSGGVVCLIFWTVVLVLWPFYRLKVGTSGHVKNGMNSNNYDYHPLLPASSSVTECTKSHENMDQCQTEAEAISL